MYLHSIPTAIVRRLRCKIYHIEILLSINYAAIRSSRPTFGWIVPDMGSGTMQTTYHIVVDDNREDAASRRGKVWNSGKVESPSSVAVEYGGEDLLPSKLYYWSVRVETNHGQRGQPCRCSARLKSCNHMQCPIVRRCESVICPWMCDVRMRVQRS